jgi:hypothetical protein
MPAPNQTVARMLIPVMIGAGCMIAALAAVNAIAAMAGLTPNIGDIVSYAPSRDDPRVADGARLIVHRMGQFGCVLDLDILRRSGGSLVVEAQLVDAPGKFRVHWAGERTSADAGNCGEQADLILDRRMLDLLALSAAGYGVGQKRLPVFVNPAGA